MKRITVIDNYDSFVYNLVRYVRECGVEVTVMRNDQIDQKIIEESDGILLSPGPGIPINAGSLMKVIEEFSATKKILGVCLGHQALAESFGGSISQKARAIHGKASSMKIAETQGLFEGLSECIDIGRYHSWSVDQMPNEFKITGTLADGTVMAMQHQSKPIFGVQFHPESILTTSGRQIIQNWINYENDIIR